MEKRFNKAELLQFLTGNCPGEEAVAINKFLKTSVGQDLLNELLNDLWDNAPEMQIDEKLLLKWKKEWSTKYKDESSNVTAKQISLNKFFRYAAVFTALIIGIGVYKLANKNAGRAKSSVSFVVQKTLYGGHSNFKLSDGTQIYLGPGSTLTYPLKFAGNTREVELKGEAYFEVVKNKEKPFVILTENVRTQVLGTTFKITSFKNLPISVSVTSGRVKVDRIDGNESRNLAILIPGEQLAYNDSLGVVRSAINIESIKRWKQGHLIFNGTPFHEMAAEIGRWYNLTFVIRDPLLNKVPVTLTLDTKVPVKKLLNTLSLTLGFDYELTGNQVIIKSITTN